MELIWETREIRLGKEGNVYIHHPRGQFCPSCVKPTDSEAFISSLSPEKISHILVLIRDTIPHVYPHVHRCLHCDCEIHTVFYAHTQCENLYNVPVCISLLAMRVCVNYACDCMRMFLRVLHVGNYAKPHEG